jgi:hypothetical protein
MLAATAVLAMYGCIDDDTGTSVVTDRGAIQVFLDFPVLNLPGGPTNVPLPPVFDLDTVSNPTDMFGRGAPDRNPWFIQSGDLDIDATQPDNLTGLRFFFHDLRLPRLQEYPWEDDGGQDRNNTVGNIDFLEFQRPDRSSRIDRWDYGSDIDWAGEEDSYYAVGLARYGVKVNGLVDHLEILVYNGELAEPDSLILMGGTPAGYPDHEADFWVNSAPPDDYCPPMLANANPFIMGHFKTGPTPNPKDTGADGVAETDADFCFLGSGIWQSGYIDPLDPDSIPFAPNNFETFDLPQYNYLVTWEYDRATNTVHYDKPYLRAQIGIDLDYQTGAPVAHGFAPLPAPPGAALSDFASYEDFLADPLVTPGVTSLDMLVFDLKPLASGSNYQVWLFNELDDAVVRVSPTYTLQRPDTVGFDELDNPIIEWVDEMGPGTVDSFDGALGWRHVIELRDSDLGGVVLSDYSYAAVTIQGSTTGSDGSPLTSPVPTCYRYTDRAGSPELEDDLINVSGDMATFCHGLLTEGTDWTAFGSGLGQFLNVEGFSIGLDRLALPPLGYYYSAWVLDRETNSYIGLGEIVTPPPEQVSLFDADLGPAVDTQDWVTDGEIFAGGKWAVWADLGTFNRCIMSQVSDACAAVVTLEPKDGDHTVMSDNVIFIGAIPKDLDKVPPEGEFR